jgi:hypothetical protein
LAAESDRWVRGTRKRDCAYRDRGGAAQTGRLWAPGYCETP